MVCRFQRCVDAHLTCVLQLPDIGDANYPELESHLTSAAAAVIASLDELLAAAKGSPAERRTAAVGGFTQAYQEFLSAGMSLAAACRVSNKVQYVRCSKITYAFWLSEVALRFQFA